MKDGQDFTKLIQNIPNAIKIWVGIVISLAGLIIAIRTEKNLYLGLTQDTCERQAI